MLGDTKKGSWKREDDLNELSVGFLVCRAADLAHVQADCSVLGMFATEPGTTRTEDLELDAFAWTFPESKWCMLS